MSEWPTISRRVFVGLCGFSTAGGFASTAVADTDKRIRWLDSEVFAANSSATIVDGTVYIGTWESGLIAFEQSGQKRWSFEDTGNFFRLAPAVVDRVCYAKDTPGSLYALEAHTGELLWSIGEEFPGSSSPTVYKDCCYVCGGGRLAAVDTFTGELEWTSDEILDPVGTGPTVSNGLCFVSGEDGVTAHNIHTGEKQWEFDEAGHAENVAIPVPGVVATDGVVYVGSDHGSIYAIGAETGESLWMWSSESAKYLTTPTISGDYLGIIGHVSIPYNPHNSSATEMILLDVTTDQPHVVKKITRSRAPSMSPPTTVGELIVWTADPSSVIIYSMRDDSFQSVRIPDGTRSDPVVVDGEVYLGIEEGVLAVDLDVEGSSSGLRVAQGSTGHHDSWAETASLEIDSMDVVLEETTLEVGDETNTAVTATFANGREEPVLERATLESTNSDVATVDTDGIVRAVSAGETDIAVTYRDETEHIELVVEGDDSMPAPGIVGTAVGIGSGAYILKRSGIHI